MPLVRLTLVTTFAVLLACTVLFGQAAAPITDHQSSKVHGTVQDFPNSPVVHAMVKFESKNFTESFFTNEAGYYEADLPAGLYTMDVSPFRPYQVPYHRPLFRVTPSTNLTMDFILDVAVSCDLAVRPGDPPPTEEDSENACGSSNLFPVPSEDNIPFQLTIRFGARRPTAKGYDYRSRTLSRDSAVPVYAAYNLFTLEADHVIYDMQSHILQATGRVVASNADGATQNADSMTFRIENGQAVRLP